MLDPESGNYFSLTDVGARIWELCDGNRTVADIATELAEEYDARPSVIEEDVRELLEELSAEGLLESG